MKQETIEKLNKILKDNVKWPLVIEGVTASNFPKAIVIPAIISPSELGIIPSDTGLKYPSWVMQLMISAKKSTRNILVIDGLDRIIENEQNKFWGMLSSKGINGYKFPNETQIIIPISNGSKDKISQRILSLALYFKVE